MNAIIVHGGKEYCNYINDCVEQFFLFNADAKLFCIADQNFAQLDELANRFSNFQVILSSSLKKSAAHRFYLAFNRSAHNTWRGGFWRFVVERFFLIAEFMKQSGEENLLHFEYDNLIYANINSFESKFNLLSMSKKILLPADGDTRCIAGIMFIPDAESLEKFCKFYNRHFTVRIKNDMLAFSDFIDLCPDFCSTLPVVPESYTNGKTEMKSQKGITHTKLNRLSNGADNFKAIFDAATYGQFVGGIDNRNLTDSTKDTIGFINPDSAFNMKDFSIEWKNEDDLKKPFLCFQKEVLPLFNLHIHSKKLDLYRSDL